MGDMKMPNPLWVVNDWIKALNTAAGNRVAPKLPGTMPAIRIANVGPRDRGPEEHLARVQVECWADDDDAAANLAATVEAGVPDLAGTYPYPTDGVYAHCAGGGVAAGPFAAPDPNSQRYRYILDVELWLYPLPTP